MLLLEEIDKNIQFNSLFLGIRDNFYFCPRETSGFFYLRTEKSLSSEAVFSLKLVSAIFYQIFIFSSSDRPSKTMKNVFYFILTALFVPKTFKFL